MTTPVRTPKPRGRKKPPRHMSAAQKAEAIALWESGNVTLDMLAKKFKKDKSTLMRLFQKEGAAKGSAEEETKQKVAEAVEKAIVSDATVLAERIRDTKEEHYKMASALARLTWGIIAEARKAGKPVATIATDMKALQAAAQILKTTREERYAVLGITSKDDDPDKPLPELVIKELDPDDIRKISQQIEEINDGSFDTGIDAPLDLPDESDSFDGGSE
ncbi:hypothetical protein LJC19_04785 [Oxalobacter sp. OttesenSCG-928-P03]|nr:hypothetical protein [Oxalobacter sp. OttesenSCG-928-P03]